MSEQALTRASRQIGTDIPVNAKNSKSLKHESPVAERLAFRFPANLPTYVSGPVMSDDFLSNERKMCGILRQPISAKTLRIRQRWLRQFQVEGVDTRKAKIGVCCKVVQWPKSAGVEQ